MAHFKFLLGNTALDSERGKKDMALLTCFLHSSLYLPELRAGFPYQFNAWAAVHLRST